MLRKSAILRLLVGGALMAPLLAFGHACEFLVGKLDVRPGWVQLEITADYGGNPMLADEAAARAAVQRILQVRLEGADRPLQELAPMTFERRQHWDPATPATFSPPPDGLQHELLTAIWRWPATVSEITFSVPKGSPNDILLWTTAKNLPGKEAQWMLLIEGDRSPTILIPSAMSHGRQWWLLLAIATGLVMLLVRLARGCCAKKTSSES